MRQLDFSESLQVAGGIIQTDDYVDTGLGELAAGRGGSGRTVLLGILASAAWDGIKGAASSIWGSIQDGLNAPNGNPYQGEGSGSTGKVWNGSQWVDGD